MAVVFVPLAFNWAWASRTDDYSARDWAYDLLQSVEPYGILFTNGDNDTFPLWYLQEVEGIRQDVTVIVGEYLSTQWYPRQLRDRTSPERQRPFRDEEELGLYEPSSPPAQAITTLSDAELDSARFVSLRQSYTVDLGPIALEYPAGFQFSRGSQIALAIIRDSINERPIHFASTGALARDLGLDRWSVRQGLASKLRVVEPQPEPGVIQVSPELGGEWIDLDRSLTLAREVFSYRGLRDREVWADGASTNIPWQFYFLYLQLADATSQVEGSEELVDELRDEAEPFAVTALGGSRGAR